MKLDKRWLLMSSLHAMIGFLLFPLIMDNYEVWFKSGQYSNSFDSFLNFFRWVLPIGIFAFLVGVFYPENETKKKVLSIGSIILFVFALLGLISGSQFTMEAPTEEYVLHFMFVQNFTIFFLMGLGMSIRSLLTLDLTNKALILMTTYAFLSGWVVKIALGFIGFIGTFHYWLIITLLTAIIALIYFRQLKFSKNENS